MADLFENPMGLMGFEFVEFAAPVPNTLEPLFERMGFTLVARHRSKDVVLFRQGDINFIVNREPRSIAGYFAAEHGPSACGLAFRVKDSHLAYQRALALGAQPIDIPTGPMAINCSIACCEARHAPQPSHSAMANPNTASAPPTPT